MLEYQKHGRFLKDGYKFGINWANEFIKTMMQQVYKKGTVVEALGRKIIFALQDVGLQYVQAHYDTSGLRKAQDIDAIHFYTFAMVWNESSKRWQIEFRDKLSTNTEGVRRILSGAAKERFISEDKFIENVKRKLH